MISSPAYQYDYYKKILTPPEDPFIDIDELDRSQNICHGIQKYVYHFNPIDCESILIKGLEELYPNCDISVSGRHVYPAGGHLGWHTNSNSPGNRIYLSYVDKPNKSFFRYVSNDQEITSYDKKGWNMREFMIGETPLWHCVYTKTVRLSLGFRVTSKI